MEKWPTFGKRNSGEAADPVDSYRVYATDEEMRKLLQHYDNVSSFRDSRTRLDDDRIIENIKAAMAARYEALRGQEKEAPNQKIDAVQQAVATIEGYKQQVNVEGAVDTEPNDLDAILTRLRSGEINAPTALVLAHHVISRRSNYH